MRALSSFAVLVLTTVFPGIPSAYCQEKPPACDPKLRLVEMERLVSIRGRFQDLPQTAAERRILSLGKKAIPMLIGCLQDDRKTKVPVFNFWPETRVGDIAFSLLVDLFLDQKQERPTLEGVITYQDISAESSPDTPAWEAWANYIAKHGRSHIQNVWLKKWTENKGRIVWDKKEKCFRVK